MLRKLPAWGFRHTEHITACSFSLEMAFSAFSQDIPLSVFMHQSRLSDHKPFQLADAFISSFQGIFPPILCQIIACSSILSSLYGISLTSTWVFPSIFSTLLSLALMKSVSFLYFKLFLSFDFPSH